ncbi:MAG TPA: hypothetical protein PK095_07560 [Myxococcota bacterium]|nr:hypothetical protein [Myxococcota bacterium]
MTALSLAAASPAPTAEVWVFDVLDVVLRLGADVDKSWFGKARWLPGAKGRGVTASLERAALPPEIASWVGRELAVYDLEGRRCLKRIDALSVEAWHVGAKTPAEAIERGDRFLKASLTGVPCASSPAFALPVHLKPVLYRKASTDPRTAQPSGADHTLTSRAIAAFRETSTWRQAQSDFTAWDPSSPPPTPTWDVLFGTEPRVTRWVGGDGATLLAVSANTRADSPGPGQVATAVFKLDGDRLSLVTAAPTDTPMAWVDLEGDGVLESIDFSVHVDRSLRIVRWHPEGTLVEGGLLDGQLEVLTDFMVPRHDTP